MQTSLAKKEERRDRGPSAIEPAAVLPEQIGGAFANGAGLQPEKRLMLAVLEDAVAVFMREAARDSHEASADFEAARVWIASDAAEWPFSFVNICRALGLEPSSIRRGLREWGERQLALAPESRIRVRSPFRRMNGTRTKTRAHAPGLKLAVA
jgi:hypothetical protein